MVKIPLLDIKNNKITDIELDPLVFDGKVNYPLMHQAVVTYLSNQRKGLACTKTRADVKGSGKKPWRQKGTGRARVGSIRSPLWRKGGIVFGPRPRSYYKELPKRMKALALKSALNAKLKDNEILVLEELRLETHKTKDFFKIVKNIEKNNKKITFVVENLDNNLKLASRNIKNINVEGAEALNTYTALNCKNLVFTKKSLRKIEERIKKYLK